MQRKSLLAAVFTVGLMGFGAAQAQYSAIVSVAPPAPRHEVVPAAREGWTWAPGHYEWRGNEYAWVEGHWLRERVGYEYREPRWVQRADGSWIFVGNNWERRMERRAERHARGRDWDGDGIPDRRDRFPRNANRS
jgi:WXXGXW repeat (2 copies)